MASIIAICNMALTNVGKDNISELNEPTAEARACKQFYEHVRDTLLQSYPWRFAGKTQSLAQLTNDKLGAWAFAYSRPTDCLKVRWVRPQYSRLELSTQETEIAHPYDIEGETIYCNLSPAFLRYTVKLSDSTKYPSLFVEALAWHLAVRLAMPLTRDPKVRADTFQLARAMTGEAQTADANEVRETSDHESDLIKARD